MVRRSLLTIAALLLTVSCSTEQKGATPPPPPAAAQPAPTVTPTAQATPFVSSADEAGAFAFVREYLSSLETAFATGDLSQVAVFRQPTCVECLNFEQQIRDEYGAGNKLLGVKLTVQDLILGQSGPSFAKVTARVDASPSTTIRADGTRVPEPGGRGNYFLLLTRQGQSWVVDTLINQVRPV